MVYCFYPDTTTATATTGDIAVVLAVVALVIDGGRSLLRLLLELTAPNDTCPSQQAQRRAAREAREAAAAAEGGDTEATEATKEQQQQQQQVDAAPASGLDALASAEAERAALEEQLGEMSSKVAAVGAGSTKDDLVAQVNLLTGRMVRT